MNGSDLYVTSSSGLLQCRLPFTTLRSSVISGSVFRLEVPVGVGASCAAVRIFIDMDGGGRFCRRLRAPQPPTNAPYRSGSRRSGVSTQPPRCFGEDNRETGLPTRHRHALLGTQRSCGLEGTPGSRPANVPYYAVARAEAGDGTENGTGPILAIEVSRHGPLRVAGLRVSPRTCAADPSSGTPIPGRDAWQSVSAIPWRDTAARAGRYGVVPPTRSRCRRD